MSAEGEPGPNPGGYCLCGCGAEAPVASRNLRRAGWVKGQPIKYVNGHNARAADPIEPPNPSGSCECGCGAKTPPARYSSSKFGWVKGQPVRFVHGHHARRQSLLFDERIAHDASTGCHVWTGTRNPAGYGRFGDRLAHRIAYERKHGPIPAGLEPDHLCRNRGCVNADHLELVTSAVNTQRGAKAKLNARAVAEIRAALAAGVRNDELASRYGVSAPTISFIKHRRTWKNV